MPLEFISNVINMMTIPAIAFSLFSLILIIVLKVKTPAFTFLMSSLKGRPILQVDRKDGQTEFISGEYGAGTIKNEKYGIYIVDPEGVKRELMSGAQIHRCIDSIGVTLSEKIVNLIRGLKKMGFKDYDDVHKYLNLLIKCNGVKTVRRCKCGFTDFGRMKEDPRDKKKKRFFKNNCPECGKPLVAMTAECQYRGPGKPVENTETKEVYLLCPQCGSHKVEHDHIEVKTPLYMTAGTADYEQFFKYNFNPDRENVIVKREVKNEMAKEKAFPVRFIAIGIMILLILFGVGLAWMMIGPDLTAYGANAAKQSLIPDLGGITG